MVWIHYCCCWLLPGRLLELLLLLLWRWVLLHGASWAIASVPVGCQDDYGPPPRCRAAEQCLAWQLGAP